MESLSLSKDDWVLILEQSMLVLIIIATWLRPRGELTHQELSGLLLHYIGTASDCIDFFSAINEDEKLTINPYFIYTILTIYSWSLFQFIFVVTVTKKSSDDDGDDDGDDDDDDDEELDEKGKMVEIDARFKVFSKRKKKRKNYWKIITKKIELFVESEAWAVFVTVALQDGAFLLVRLTCIFHWNINSYTMYFFSAKNALVLALQVRFIG